LRIVAVATGRANPENDELPIDDPPTASAAEARC